MISDTEPSVSMIVAMAENRVIGRDNKLPWYLPGDLKYFKATTLGKPIIMGRKTYQSIGRPLPGRANIVVSRNSSFEAQGVKVVASLDQALKLASDIAFIDGVGEVVVIGGAQLYAEALPRIDRLYLTLVHAEVQGDAYFPDFSFARWQQVSREDFDASGPNPYNYSFIVYDALK